MDDEYYNYAFPGLSESTGGVDPREDPYAFARLLASQMPKDVKLETLPTPPQQPLPATSAMQGTGVSEEVTEKVQQPVSSADSEDKLSADEKINLQKKIDNVQAKVASGPLVVKSLAARKTKDDSADVNQALDEEGYGGGQRQKKKAKLVHFLTFE